MTHFLQIPSPIYILFLSSAQFSVSVLQVTVCLHVQFQLTEISAADNIEGRKIFLLSL